MSLAALVLCATLGSMVEYPDIGAVRVREGDDASWSQPVLDEAAWDTSFWWQVNPQGRLIWLRAHIDLPASFDTAAEPFGVYIAAPVSYEAWWNGVRVATNGVPATNAAGETPGRIDTAIFIPPHLLQRKNVLALRMSSFHLSRTLHTPMQWIKIRRHGYTTTEVVRTKALPFVASGALLLGAVYFAALFLSNRRDRSPLLLALLSLAILGQLIAESARDFFAYAYPLHILRVETILAFAAIGSILLVAYIANRYAPAWRMRLVGAAIACAGAIIALAPSYDGKTVLVMLSAVLLSMVAAIAGARRREPAAVTVIVAMSVALLLFAIDTTAFLDRAYYVEATVLMVILFAQQVRTLREAQNRRARLELELLKQQIQPHFLMNSLTALTEWIESEPAVGVKMIEALAEEFRVIATMSGESTVTLGQEIELCRHHLKVMSFRKNQQFDLRADNVRLDARVPPAIFHTLIENALTHNDYADGAIFSLEEAPSSGSRRTYRLRTPLRQVPTAPSIAGRGHQYVKARLTEVFGERWRFSSGPHAPDEWVDAIEVPVS